MSGMLMTHSYPSAGLPQAISRPPPLSSRIESHLSVQSRVLVGPAFWPTFVGMLDLNHTLAV
jgi:hypothetical protein